MPCEVLPGLHWQPVRVVASRRKRREIDPLFLVQDAHLWRIWIWEGRPLAQISWDPGEWLWPHHVSGTAPLSFFAYSVRSARCALVSRQSEHPTRLRMWIHAGLDHLFLRQFWSALWRLHVAARICYFLWMVAHAGLAVGVWSSSMGHDPTCQRCLQEPESISHCLWACPVSVDVWRAVSLLLSRAGV